VAVKKPILYYGAPKNEQYIHVHYTVTGPNYKSDGVKSKKEFFSALVIPYPSGGMSAVPGKCNKAFQHAGTDLRAKQCDAPNQPADRIRNESVLKITCNTAGKGSECWCALPWCGNEYYYPGRLNQDGSITQLSKTRVSDDQLDKYIGYTFYTERPKDEPSIDYA